MKHTIKIIALLVVAGIFHSCIKNDNDEEQNPKPKEQEQPTDTTTTPADTVKWSAHIKPIIDTRCAVSGCHANSASPNLRTYAQVFANRARIKVRAVNDGTMPPSSHTQLTATQKEQLGKWIDAGALEN